MLRPAIASGLRRQDQTRLLYSRSSAERASNNTPISHLSPLSVKYTKFGLEKAVLRRHERSQAPERNLQGPVRDLLARHEIVHDVERNVICGFVEVLRGEFTAINESVFS